MKLQLIVYIIGETTEPILAGRSMPQALEHLVHCFCRLLGKIGLLVLVSNSMSTSIHITILRKCSLVILPSQRPCQEAEVVLCQLSATGVTSVGIEGEVGHEIVGYGVADELTGYMVEVGDEEEGLQLLLVVHRIVGMTDVLSTVHDGAELSFGEVGNEKDVFFTPQGRGALLPFGIFSSLR